MAGTLTFSTRQVQILFGQPQEWSRLTVQQVLPVESGCRWVLTYNLITGSDAADYSAQELSTRLEDLRDLLARWQESSTPQQFMVYPLEHQYTNDGLELAHLKGQDAHRARHVLRGCRNQGDFYMFLGNMELIVIDPNDEAEDEEYWHREIILRNIFSPSGFELLQNSSISIRESALLLDIYDQDRQMDTQRGGGYLGNQHAEVHQVYKDSASLTELRSGKKKLAESLGNRH